MYTCVKALKSVDVKKEKQGGKMSVSRNVEQSQ